MSLYKPIRPKLCRFPTETLGPLYLGTHCRGPRDIRYIRSMASNPLNLVEVKPEGFRGAARLFDYRKGSFHANWDNFKRYVAEFKELKLDVQFHFPPRLLHGRSLNPGISADHELIYSVFSELAEVITRFDLRQVVTFHPPAMAIKGKTLIHPLNTAMALDNTRRLFDLLEQRRRGSAWPIRVGIENQADPKADADILGYLPNHLYTIIAGAPSWVEFALDSGHRQLSSRLSTTQIVEMAFSLGRRIINFHLHENIGAKSDSYQDDLHDAPTEGRLKGGLNYINRAVQERIPIVIEINTRRNSANKFFWTVWGMHAVMQQIDQEFYADMRK